MLNKLNNIGDEIYRTWTKEQCRKEIGNLVEGYRNGLSAKIVCELATSIAGNQVLASEHLLAFLTAEERTAIAKRETGADKKLRVLLRKA